MNSFKRFIWTVCHRKKSWLICLNYVQNDLHIKKFLSSQTSKISFDNTTEKYNNCNLTLQILVELFNVYCTFWILVSSVNFDIDQLISSLYPSLKYIETVINK